MYHSKCRINYIWSSLFLYNRLEALRVSAHFATVHFALLVQFVIVIRIDVVVMTVGSRFYSWLLCKWLVLVIFTVLVNPGLLGDNPGAGPSNEQNLQCRKRRLVATCDKCNFKAKTKVSDFISQLYYLIILLISLRMKYILLFKI